LTSVDWFCLDTCKIKPKNMKNLILILSVLTKQVFGGARVYASGSSIRGNYSYGKKDWPGGSIQGDLFDGEIRR
jgi:hypothetical protein